MLRGKEERLKVNLNSLQEATNTLQRNNDTLKIDLDMANQFIDILQQEKVTKGEVERIQSKLREITKQRDILDSRNEILVSEIERFEQKNLNHEEAIQHHEHENRKIQNKLTEWQRWYDTIVGKDTEMIQKLAKIEMINSKFSHPYYWAAFILMGD